MQPSSTARKVLVVHRAAGYAQVASRELLFISSPGRKQLGEGLQVSVGEQTGFMWHKLSKMVIAPVRLCCSISE